MQLTPDTIDRAYETVEDMLRDAVENAPDQYTFYKNMAFCQIVATRMLAILIFNSYVQSTELGKGDLQLADYLEKGLDGVKQELAMLADDFEKNGAETIEKDFGG